MKRFFFIVALSMMWSLASARNVIVKLADLQAMGLTTDTLVDLGLSVKWANFNVGASKCYEYGNYYQWGETAVTGFYGNNSCKTDELSISELRGQGIIGADSSLTANYDAATVNWGAKYRMPSYYEIDELINNTESKWLTIKMPDGRSVNGRIAKSKKNGKSVFFPAAGLRIGDHTIAVGQGGYCWSASGFDVRSYLWFFDFNSWIFLPNNYYSRVFGHSVRPVSDF